MARENPTWGAPRIAAELRLLGHDVATATVSKYLPMGCRSPSPTWRTFLRNHIGSLASVDFCVVPTVTFRVLYVFVVLCHERRRVVHVNVTAHPTAARVAQQLREAFPFGAAPKYLIRDRDSIYGQEVRHCLRSLGVEEVIIAPRSPWQNPYVEFFRNVTAGVPESPARLERAAPVADLEWSTWRIITRRIRTWPWPATRRSRAPSSRRPAAACVPPHTSAACTTATPAARDHPLRQCRLLAFSGGG
jgi:hypothetical protein